MKYSFLKQLRYSTSNKMIPSKSALSIELDSCWITAQSMVGAIQEDDKQVTKMQYVWILLRSLLIVTGEAASRRSWRGIFERKDKMVKRKWNMHSCFSNIFLNITSRTAQMIGSCWIFFSQLWFLFSLDWGWCSARFSIHCGNSFINEGQNA